MSELKTAIEKKLKELRYECALKRLYVKQAFGRRWSGCPRDNPEKPSSWDLHWENLQSDAQIQRPKDVISADKLLAELISESRPIMGNDWPGTDHGRLCWHSYCGGFPIDRFYCEKEEGHEGVHSGHSEGNEKRSWPNSPLQEVTSDSDWHKLVELCPHETTTIQNENKICAVCGVPMKGIIR